MLRVSIRPEILTQSVGILLHGNETQQSSVIQLSYLYNLNKTFSPFSRSKLISHVKTLRVTMTTCCCLADTLTMLNLLVYHIVHMADSKVICFADFWSGNQIGYFTWNPKYQPSGDTRGKVKTSPKALRFFICGPRIHVPTLVPIQQSMLRFLSLDQCGGQMTDHQYHS